MGLEPQILEARLDDDDIAVALADEFGVDREDIEFEIEVEAESDFGVDYWKVEHGRREYLVFENDDDAFTLAKNRVAQDLEDDPSMFSQDWLQSHIYITDTDRRLIAQEEADDYAHEVLDDEDVVREANREDEYEEALDAEDDARAEQIVSESRESVSDQKYREVYVELDNPIQYFVHDRGIYRMDELMKAPFIQIDIDEASDEAVRTDGAAHFLATYDGDEQEAARGIVYYRTN